MGQVNSRRQVFYRGEIALPLHCNPDRSLRYSASHSTTSYHLAATVHTQAEDSALWYLRDRLFGPRR